MRKRKDESNGRGGKENIQTDETHRRIFLRLCGNPISRAAISPRRDDRPTIGEHVHYKTMTHLFRPNCRGITGLEDVTRIRGNRFPARTRRDDERKKKRKKRDRKKKERKKTRESSVDHLPSLASYTTRPFLDSLTFPPTSLLASFSSRSLESRQKFACEARTKKVRGIYFLRGNFSVRLLVLYL